MELYNNTSGSSWIFSSILNSFPNKISGTIEFWSKITIVSGGTTGQGVGNFVIGDRDLGDSYPSIQNSIFLKIEDGRLKYMGPTWLAWNDICPYSANKWYHFKIEFDCSSNWHLWLDGESKDNGNGYGYVGNPIDMDTFRCHTERGASDYSFYFDAIGYSWDPNYNIGDNFNEGLLLSYENTTNLEWKGYSLNGQINKTILGNSTVPMPSDGLHTIQMFGNNSRGTMYESAVQYFSVDTAPPELSITYPSAAQEFSIAPSYILSITEENIAAM